MMGFHEPIIPRMNYKGLLALTPTYGGTLAKLALGLGRERGRVSSPPALDLIGAPDRNRTCNPWIRSPILYPIELRAHIIFIIEAIRKSNRKSSPLYTGPSEDPSTLKDWKRWKILLFPVRWSSLSNDYASFILIGEKPAPHLRNGQSSCFGVYCLYKRRQPYPFHGENSNDSDRTIVSRYDHVLCKRTLL